ncbi:MAG: efflux transporter periplasmic adaptor subunit [Nevskia sp.]|nr:efflux transporter periplasmic adaptor subunit [Nevskia sp.]
MKRALKYTLCAVASAAAIGVVAAPRVRPLLNASPAPKSAVASHANATAPLKVSSVVVHTEPFAETVTSTGTLRAEESVDLQAEISGKVVAINFVEGARVRKGDLLVKLNDADLRAGREAAVQREKLAVLQERRLGQLLPEGYVTRGEYDIALNQANVQHAEVALIDAQIEKTEIRAPFDGTVGLRYISDGAYVNVNASTSSPTRVATLQQLDKLKIDFAVPEKYAGRIRLGDAIRFTVPGGDHAYQGEIYALDPRIDNSTHTVVLRALCPNPEHRLMPGAFANIELSLKQIDDAILVPAQAIIAGLNVTNVFVVSEGKATPRAVELGTRLQSTVHILSGLKPGDVVITSGLQQMRAGLPVVTETAAIASGPA